jgi:hypothetical protein
MPKKHSQPTVNIQISGITSFSTQILAHVGNNNEADPELAAELRQITIAFEALERESAPIVQQQPRLRKALASARKHVETITTFRKADVIGEPSLSRRLRTARRAVKEVGALATASAQTAPQIAGAAVNIGAAASSLCRMIGHIAQTFAGS